MDEAREFRAKREGGTVEGGVVLVFAACLGRKISWGNGKWEIESCFEVLALEGKYKMLTC
jgi:hypothetical protein